MSLEMDYETVFTVIESWESLRRIKDYETIAGTTLFAHLFEKCPPTKVFFGFPLDMDPRSERIKENAHFQNHARYMIQMLDRALNLLGPDAELLGEILTSLGKSHARIGVQEQFFPYMGEALMATLQDILGDDLLTPQIKNKWNIVYEALATSMIKAMNNERLVLDSWAKLKSLANYEEVAGGVLFREMFRKCPQSKTLFGFPLNMDVDSSVILSSRRFKTHSKYFIDMLDRALGMVEAKQMQENMKQLGELHSDFGVKESYFPIMGEALFHTLEVTLKKEDFDVETRLAWADVYGKLSSQMISAMKTTTTTTR